MIWYTRPIAWATDALPLHYALSMRQSPPVTCVYDCTREELAHAEAFLAGSTNGKSPPMSDATRKMRTVLGWVLFLGLVMLLIFLMQRRGHLPSIQTPTLVDLIVLGAGVVCLIWAVHCINTSRIATLQRWRGQVHCSFDAEGITQQRPGKRDFWTWGCFCGFKETCAVFVVLFDNKNALVYPKRLFREDDLVLLRELLNGKLARPAIDVDPGFPVVMR